jgi:transcriptional regulator GlxA family with amidase domain
MKCCGFLPFSGLLVASKNSDMKKYSVGIFLFDDVEVLDFAGPFEVFSVTSQLNNYEPFSVFTISETGEEINAVNGLNILPDFSFEDHPDIDILIIPGGDGTRELINKQVVIDWVNEISHGSEITMSVCSGARILAKAGLLDGHNSITHHEVIKDVKNITSETNILEGKRFVDEGKIMTSGGITAGIDLSLHVVEKLFGKSMARETVIYMEYGDWRKLL